MKKNSSPLQKNEVKEELSLFRVVNKIQEKDIDRLNKKKEWKYGYNPEFDVVVISKDGTIGEVYEIQGLHIALPSVPKNVYKRDRKKEEQYWEAFEYPKELQKINSVFQWNEYPNEFKNKYVDFIESEFDRREGGFWFTNNGVPTYVTGTNYMYLQWTKIDVGHPEYREANRIFYLFWEACVADERCYGMCYLKNRRSGFSFMSSSELVNTATLARDSRLGILSKTGSDAKKMFTDKVVPISGNYPFFFKPIMDGMDKPKTELAYRVPASKITKNNMSSLKDDVDGLDTTIDWKNTGDNSYDGEKLLRLVHDECYDPNTLILTENLVFKKIKDINIGDKVIIENGLLKTVVNKTFGNTDTYLVKQKYGKDYIVTKNHRLVLNRYISKKTGSKEIIITPEEYINYSDYKKKHITRVVSKGLEFEDKDISIHPYLLGLWLGDGRSNSFTILVNKEEEPEILEYLGRLSSMLNIDFELKKSTCDKIVEFTFKGINSELKNINVFKNKHIPSNYMNSSIDTRLLLLAGLIDTDGYSNKKNNTIEFGMSRKDLIEQIRLLALSCGLSCSNISYKKSNFNTDTYRVFISGNLSIIPILTEKKSFEGYVPNCLNRRNNVDIEYLGKGDYVGIQVDGIDDNERKLILEDFTVSLNSGKWEVPNNILNNWKVTKTCLRLGRRIIGKCMMGSTSNSISKGGGNYKKLYTESDVTKRNANGQTLSGLYALFIPMEWNFEGYIDIYGQPVMRTPEKPIRDIQGGYIYTGVIDYWENEVHALKTNSDALNEFYRQFPRTESHAFRDEAKNSLFDLSKIYEQIDFNDGLEINQLVFSGKFSWKNGVKDSEVVWTPSRDGDFKVSWFPNKDMANNIEIKNGSKHPGNIHVGAFGCDTYDISGVVGGGGSKGSLHGLTKFNMSDAPSNFFFLEYIARPRTSEEFYENCLMACVFYGMPILIENNKVGQLKYFYNRGYGKYCLRRPDKHKNDLSQSEKELGGIPSSTQVIELHANALEAYIDQHVGVDYSGQSRDAGQMGNMYFNRTLLDWANYDISNRTKFDATVSSGFAIMANQSYIIKPVRNNKEIMINFARYSNKGLQSELLK